jgi:hypothetical protein
LRIPPSGMLPSCPALPQSEHLWVLLWMALWGTLWGALWGVLWGTLLGDAGAEAWGT